MKGQNTDDNVNAYWYNDISGKNKPIKFDLCLNLNTSSEEDGDSESNHSSLDLQWKLDSICEKDARKCRLYIPVPKFSLDDIHKLNPPSNHSTIDPYSSLKDIGSSDYSNLDYDSEDNKLLIYLNGPNSLSFSHLNK